MTKKILRDLGCLALLTAGLALAQTQEAAAPDSTGTIAGRIVDQSGAMVSNVLIHLTNLGTGKAQEANPYVAGLYRFPSLPAGTYALRFQADGFTVVSKDSIDVKAGEVTRVDVGLQLSDLNTEITVNSQENVKSHTSALLGDVRVVEAATLRLQTLEEAPANVTVITAAEIKMYGYRTLGEALSSARGFYFTNDGIYQYGGVRGLNVPGDYNSRFLVMINGHPMTENIYNSNGFFQQDFGLDMDLVERIEIVRGPSTTLYGSNGILANINIVTKLPVDQPLLKVSSETSSTLEQKVHVSSALKLGKEATLLVSASAFYGGGQSVYYPVFNTPDQNNGWTNNVGLERGHHAFIDFNWKDWRFTSMLSSREINPGIGWSAALFNTQGNKVRDERNYVQAAYTHHFDAGSILRWSLAYDNYRYFDQFYYATSTTSPYLNPDNYQSGNKGDWIDSRLSYSFQLAHVGELTLGASAQFDLRALQTFTNATQSQQVVSVNRTDREEGVFAQQEVKINQQLTAYLGFRYDVSKNFPNFFSPQASIVWAPTERTIIKGVWGRPFRNPSSYEQFYGDGVETIASGGLKQETAQVFEGSIERKVTPKWSVIANYYFYQINNLIESPGLQYINVPGSDRSQGIEFEVQGRPQPWIQFVASYGYGRATDTVLNQWLVNSPSQLGKARAAFPLFNNKLHFATATQYIGPRLDLNGNTVRQAALVDFTVNTSRLNRNFDVIAGVRNALGWRYQDPVALSVPSLEQPRQTFFLKIVYHSDAN